MTRTLPAGLVLRLAGDILAQRLLLTRRHITHNPRPGAAKKAPARGHAAEILEDSVRRVRALKATGEVSAEVAGLLLAWAGGHGDAIAMLDEIEPRVADLHATDMEGACRLLLDAR